VATAVNVVGAKAESNVAKLTVDQWGRPADGHQIRTSAITATLAANTTPGHANFITITGPRDCNCRSPNNEHTDTTN
jgi:hypothetical protein